jgi:hypothetical protein
MAWFSLIATALGAVIAFSGSTLSDGLRSRRELIRSQLEPQHRTTMDFIMSINNAHELLRDAAGQSVEASELSAAAREAIKDSGLYATREQMLISVSPEVALAAESAFHSIIAIRDAVSAGGTLDSSPYRPTRHRYRARRARRWLRGEPHRNRRTGRLVSPRRPWSPPPSPRRRSRPTPESSPARLARGDAAALPAELPLRAGLARPASRKAPHRPARSRPSSARGPVPG